MTRRLDEILEEVGGDLKDLAPRLLQQGIQDILEGKYQSGIDNLKKAVEYDPSYKGQLIRVGAKRNPLTENLLRRQVEERRELLMELYEAWKDDPKRTAFRSALAKHETIVAEYKRRYDESTNTSDLEWLEHSCYWEAYSCRQDKIKGDPSESPEVRGFITNFDELLSPLEIDVLFQLARKRRPESMKQSPLGFHESDLKYHIAYMVGMYIQTSFNSGNNDFSLTLPEEGLFEFDGLVSGINGTKDRSLRVTLYYTNSPDEFSMQYQSDVELVGICPKPYELFFLEGHMSEKSVYFFNNLVNPGLVEDSIIIANQIEDVNEGFGSNLLIDLYSEVGELK